MKITIDGLDCYLDVDLAKKTGALTVEPIRLGQYFLDKETNKIYHLCMVEPNKMCLISAVGGNRFTDPERVTSYADVTSEEFRHIALHKDRFIRIDVDIVHKK